MTCDRIAPLLEPLPTRRISRWKYAVALALMVLPALLVAWMLVDWIGGLM